MDNMDDLIDPFDEWEVVSIQKSAAVSTDSPKVTAVNTKEKPLPLAKQNDIDALAKRIDDTLQLKHHSDQKNLLHLQSRLAEQNEISQAHLLMIQNQLERIGEMQRKATFTAEEQKKEQERLARKQKELDKQMMEKAEMDKVKLSNLQEMNQTNRTYLESLANMLWAKKEKEEEVKNKDEDYKADSWNCTSCHSENEEACRFCPKCGQQNEFFSDVLGFNKLPFAESAGHKVDEKESIFKQVDIGSALKLKSFVGADNTLKPGEKAQLGWVLYNCTNQSVHLKCSLHSLDEDSLSQIVGLQVEFAAVTYDVVLQPGEEIYVVLNVVAPCLSGEYCLFFQLYDSDDISLKIGDVLQLKINVKAKFNKAKEKKIETVVGMGFSDREKIEAMLIKHKWNVEEALNALV